MLRILIVDDEELIRLGIESKLRKSPFDIGGIAHAQNASEALEAAARLQPDIALCDISMDGPNGLHLSRRLTAMQPGIKIIIISGYNEFSYAQQAIQIGVVDYLLKPVETALLNEALQKCVDLIGERRRSSHALSVVEHGQLQKRLRALATDYLEGRASNPGALFADYRPAISRFWAAYLYLDQSFSLFFDSFLENTAGRFPRLEPGRNLMYFEYRHNEYLIALCAEADSRDAGLEPLVRAVAGALPAEHPKCTPGLYAMGTAGPCSELRTAVSQAAAAMRHRLFFPGRAVIRFGDTAPYTVPYQIDSSRITLLRLAMQKREAKRMMSILDDWARELESGPYSYDSLQSLYLRLLVLLDELQGPIPQIHPMHYPKDLYIFSSVADMLDFVKDALLEIVQVSKGVASGEDHRRQAVQQVKGYVDDNYAQEISLKEIADRIPINYCYLSILFKEMTHINFRDYVIQVRIEHAKQLLAGRHKVKDAAALTGFSNQHYFSKAFKRMTGVTPREYREGAGQ